MPNRYIEQIFVVGVERTETDPTRKPSLDETYVVYTCKTCGNLVRDSGLHDRWHEKLKRRLRALESRQEFDPRLLDG